MPTGESEVDAVRAEPFIGACECIDLPACRERAPAAEPLVPALLVSIVAHGLFVVLLLSGVLPATHVDRMLPASFRVRIVPAAIPAADEPTTATTTPALPVPAPLVDTESLAIETSPDTGPPLRQESPATVVPIRVDVPAVVPLSNPPESAVGPQLRPPSTLSIRQLVETIPAADGMTMLECTSLQRQNPLIHCVETDAERTAARLPGLVIREYMPSSATLGIMLRRYDSQRELVRNSGVVVPDYLDYQMGQILEGLSGVPLTPVVRLTDLMNLNNPAYQMIQSVTRPR